jgi:hypothetical protein
MRFALVDGNKTEATKGAKGLCPSCGSELVAKCGEVRINHWAHKGKRTCDPWWENETDWHRSWKVQFPIYWQEVIQFDENDEKHIADVKTENGWVLEFQRSYLNPEERRAREAFYTKLVWVVDGLRRKRDKPQFQKVIEESTVVSKKPLIRRINFPDECRILKEWLDCSALVFFDFQEVKELKDSFLWFLLPEISNSEAYLMRFARSEFVTFHQDKRFDEIVSTQILPIRDFLASYERNRRSNRQHIRTSRLPGFERYLAQKRRRRRF